MFNIGISEIILLLLIAFLVVGPDDLPKVARALGRFVRYVRAMIEEVKRESGFDEVADELKGMSRELKGVGRDLEQEIKGVTREVEESVKSADVRKELKDAEIEINKGLKSAEEAVGLNGTKKDTK